MSLSDKVVLQSLPDGGKLFGDRFTQKGQAVPLEPLVSHLHGTYSSIYLVTTNSDGTPEIFRINSHGAIGRTNPKGTKRFVGYVPSIETAGLDSVVVGGEFGEGLVQIIVTADRKPMSKEASAEVFDRFPDVQDDRTVEMFNHGQGLDLAGSL
jgi:hypothetical protein